MSRKLRVEKLWKEEWQEEYGHEAWKILGRVPKVADCTNAMGLCDEACTTWECPYCHCHGTYSLFLAGSAMDFNHSGKCQEMKEEGIWTEMTAIGVAMKVVRIARRNRLVYLEIDQCHECKQVTRTRATLPLTCHRCKESFRVSMPQAPRRCCSTMKSPLFGDKKRRARTAP